MTVSIRAVASAQILYGILEGDDVGPTSALEMPTASDLPRVFAFEQTLLKVDTPRYCRRPG